VKVHDLATPALLVDADAFEHNVAAMGAVRPGTALRPHVKAFKSTALAGELAAAGHTAFCGATALELLGMARAGLGDDLLLANELLDLNRLAALAELATQGARFTVAVDSDETIAAAAQAGIGEVLIDVEVGMPRGGCLPADAGRLAARAREAGLAVRGVMGYEGHLMMEPDSTKAEQVASAMQSLVEAHAEVGGDVVSGGGTGTYEVNTWVTELQAGSYTLMDTQYGLLDSPFRQALSVLATVLTVSPKGWLVADAGLKALSVDHGNPTVLGGEVWFCSDEHTTFAPVAGTAPPRVGERVRIHPSHVDPTVALHDVLHVVRGEDVVDRWPVDLRGW
jgi:D-serine deaminase-like pyridoxal phosphate-dependent protein